MAKILTDSKHYNDIAKAIIDNKELMGQIFPSEMADAINQACAEKYAKGKQEEHDKFWDSLQQNGARTNYGYAFQRYTRDMFYPKWDINLTACSEMFNYFEQYSATPFDFASRLNECKVKFSTSQLKSGTHLFYFTSFSKLPHIDLSNHTSNANYMFAMNEHLETIEKITSNEKIVWTKSFDATTALGNGYMPLKNIVFDGVIGSSIDFRWCPLLTADSVWSIINALKTLAPTDSAQTLTLHSTVKENLTTEQEARIYQRGWTLA